MHFKALTVAALAGAAFGQNLTATLANNTELTSLTNALGMYPDLVAQLSQLSNITLLAPNNAAFSTLLNSSAGAALTGGDSGAIQALFTYHVLNGTYYNITNTTFIPTALMNASFANVTGGQRVEAQVSDGNITFISGLLANSSVVGNPTNFTGGVIHVIDTVLSVPSNLSTTAVELGLSAAAGALINASLVSTVDALPGSTFFIPNNEAFEAIGSALPNLTTDQLTSILTYHVVNGTVAYSTDLSNTSLPTVQGGNVTIRLIDGDVFVNNARVTVPNVLVANGVVHVIDEVLNPNNATAEPGSNDEGEPAFPGASSTDVGFTTQAPSPTGTRTSATTAAVTSSSSGGAQPMKTGAVGAAALFGGAALVMNI